MNIEELNIRKMYFNVNADWVVCYNYRNSICTNCEEGTEFATYMYEDYGNNRYGELMIYCMKGKNMSKSALV